MEPAAAALEVFCERCGSSRAVEPEDLAEVECRCGGCGGVMVLRFAEAAPELGPTAVDGGVLAPWAPSAAEEAWSLDAFDATAAEAGGDGEVAEEPLPEAPPAGGSVTWAAGVEPGPAPATDEAGAADDADAEEDDPYALAAQALDRTVTTSLKRRRQEQEEPSADEADDADDPDATLLEAPFVPPPEGEPAGDEAESGGGEVAGRLRGLPAAAPPLPSWEGGDTQQVAALARSEPEAAPSAPLDMEAPGGGEAPASGREAIRYDWSRSPSEAIDPGEATQPTSGRDGLEGLVEVVQVPEGGTGGRGSRIYERTEVLGALPGGRGPAGPEADASEPEGAPPGDDLDWLALIDEQLPELEGLDDTTSGRVLIRIPERDAPKTDEELVRQIQETVKNLEQGGVQALGEPERAVPRPEEQDDGEKTRGWADAEPASAPGGEETRAIHAGADDPAKTQGLAAPEPPEPAHDRPPSGRSTRVIEEFHRQDLDAGLVCARDAGSPAADYFRQLYQRIFHASNGDSPRAVMVTSPRPGAGKTTVAANLAIVAARIPGRGAVLVDADPRGRGVLRAFGVRVRSEGLLEALQTDAEPRDFVLQFNLGTLDVVPLGIPGSDAPELIASTRMEDFLDRLRAAYPSSVIVIDGSSVLHSADPLVLARNVDGVVMVVRAAETTREDLRRSLEILGKKRVLGLVLNDARL